MNRWTEELTLVGYEMQWTTKYFLNCSAKWQARFMSPNLRPGPRAYAGRQAAQWKRLACEAERVFSTVNRGYIKLVM